MLMLKVTGSERKCYCKTDASYWLDIAGCRGQGGISLEHLELWQKYGLLRFGIINLCSLIVTALQALARFIQ